MEVDISRPSRLRSHSALAVALQLDRLTVQAELRVPLRRLRASAKSPSPFRFRTSFREHAPRVQQLHEVLMRYALQTAHFSFRLHHPGKRRRPKSERDNLSRFVQLHFPPDINLGRLLKDLREVPVIERAIAYTGSIPARAQPAQLDPLVGQDDQWLFDPAFNCGFQWYLYRCNVPQAWQSVSGLNVVIADVDTGFNVNHQDLAPNIEMQWAYNSVSDTRGNNALPPGQNMDHGTGVLGIAGAAMNSLGVAGVAYSAKLWSIEAQFSNGPAQPWEPIGHAIDWLTQNAPSGRRVVINVPLQVPVSGANIEQYPSVNTAIQQAIARGFVVCVAAGNGNLDAGFSYEYDDVTPIHKVGPIQPTGSILVGATNYADNDNPWAFVPGDNPGDPYKEASNYSASITVSAPGDENCDTTCAGNDFTGYTSQFGGTSGAVAKVAGAVALMLNANPMLTHEQVREILGQTGAALNPNPPIGVFLNVDAAVNAARASAQP